MKIPKIYATILEIILIVFAVVVFSATIICLLSR